MYSTPAAPRTHAGSRIGRDHAGCNSRGPAGPSPTRANPCTPPVATQVRMPRKNGLCRHPERTAAACLLLPTHRAPHGLRMIDHTPCIMRQGFWAHGAPRGAGAARPSRWHRRGVAECAVERTSRACPRQARVRVGREGDGRPQRDGGRRPGVTRPPQLRSAAGCGYQLLASAGYVCGTFAPPRNAIKPMSN